MYGLDGSLQLLAYAQDLDVIQADIFAITIVGDSMDVVFVNGVLHHLADVERAILEIRRVLSKGGVLCLIEPTSSPLRWLANKLTLSPLARFSPFLTLRKQMLEEELPCQEKWLARERLFPGLLERLGFQIIFRRRSPFSVFIKARAT
jgi:ubiquinone/menaquinone biosynthesis C-methylase UbiE